MTVADTPTIDDALVAEIERVQVALIQAARQLRMMDRAGSSQSARSALAAIVKFGPLSMSELTAHEGVDPASVSRTVRKLEESGAVARRTSETDGRVNLIEVTESGRELFMRSRRELTEIIVGRMSGFTSEQLSTVVALSEGLELLVSATEPGAA
ncbi:DNA-binding MarR family transcriptional regulator [Rhodococcus rhodochrous J45]|uniref:DNA-binding MarR family transcriptional regulator n=1 Tax=Rhodococcus rhodochrous J45 TaxID=935266 RepID=A0A562DLC2_RHORH|nr:MarR family transcriptional regulator [Rhodococcus rhodochrous]TWH10354.1 DNA-binding MarR family transcriptional regulator [Rhodococcus rhodochrous J45]